MPTTLTYGRKKPTDGDDSAVWFDALEDNIELDDAHTHDGVDSPSLDGTAISKPAVITKSTGDWSGSAGSYSLTITNPQIPAGFKSAAKSSSELTELVIMDSDSNDERVYLKYTWAGQGATATATLYSNTVLNLKILFV